MFTYLLFEWVVRGGAVGSGTALQAGGVAGSISGGVMEFFIDIILPAAVWPSV
jgi:hypothetical protein